MTNAASARGQFGGHFGYWTLVILWSLDIGHWSFSSQGRKIPLAFPHFRLATHPPASEIQAQRNRLVSAGGTKESQCFHRPAVECPVSSVVEHYLDAVGVTGSKPVSRTILAKQSKGKADMSLDLPGFRFHY